MKRTSFSILSLMACLSIFAQQEQQANAITVLTENLKTIFSYACIVGGILFAIIILIAFYKRKKSQI